MSTLAAELLRNTHEIVGQWYERWLSAAGLRHTGLSEVSIKDSLPLQLRVIGEQLRDLSRAEAPGEIWKTTERLAPEERVAQNIPIEEVVQEYALLVDTVRDRIEGKCSPPPVLTA